MLYQEAKEAYRQGKERYLSQYWNLVTLMMLALFVVSGVLWFIGHLMIVSGVKEASAKKLDYRSILLSNAFFAFGMVLAFFHISNSFQVNSMLGPLQLSLVKMVRDIVKFFFPVPAAVSCIRLGGKKGVLELRPCQNKICGKYNT